MIEPEEKPDNLAELNIGGFSTSRLGVPFPIMCVNCKEIITAVLLNQLCTVDIRVECSRCGYVAEGRNLWGQLKGKAKVTRDGNLA